MFKVLQSSKLKRFVSHRLPAAFITTFQSLVNSIKSLPVDRIRSSEMPSVISSTPSPGLESWNSVVVQSVSLACARKRLGLVTKTVTRWGNDLHDTIGFKLEDYHRLVWLCHTH